MTETMRASAAVELRLGSSDTEALADQLGPVWADWSRGWTPGTAAGQINLAYSAKNVAVGYIFPGYNVNDGSLDSLLGGTVVMAKVMAIYLKNYASSLYNLLVSGFPFGLTSSEYITIPPGGRMLFDAGAGGVDPAPAIFQDVILQHSGGLGNSITVDVLILGRSA